jgi:hypothetical protein
MNETTAVKTEIEMIRDFGGDAGTWYSIYLHVDGKRKYVSGASTVEKANEMYESIKAEIKAGNVNPQTIRREEI